jgi:hypothetical protein
MEYRSLVNGWHRTSAFTTMNQPLLAEFAHPANDLVGFGPAGMVGTAGPGLAGAAFSSFTHPHRHLVGSVHSEAVFARVCKTQFPVQLLGAWGPGGRKLK